MENKNNKDMAAFLRFISSRKISDASFSIPDNNTIRSQKIHGVSDCENGAGDCCNVVSKK